MNGTPVGLSRDLAAKRVMRAEVEGRDVVVWRDPDGGLHAWNNRCPHRGMRLSHGFVRGGKLACLYHGWHYAKDGGCSYIPAHPDLEPPATIAATAYYVTETSGVIWVKTDAAPEVPKTARNMTPLRSMILSCSIEATWSSFAATVFDGVEPSIIDAHTLKVGDRHVVLYPGIFTAGATLLHLCVDADTPVPELKALSRWCEAARRSAEGQTS